MDTTVQRISRRSLVCVAGAFVLAALALPTAAAPAKKTTAAPAEKAAQVPQIVQIELAQKLPPSKAKALQELVERFNEQSKNAQVTLVESDWRAANPPHMMILGGADEETFLSGKVRYKPLSALMKEAGVALQTVKPAAMVTRRPVAANGQLQALPVGLNTPVLYINRAAFARAGLSADSAALSTWADMQGVLPKLKSNCALTVAEPARVFLENASAWSNVPLLKGKQPIFNDLFHVKYIAQMASWQRAGLMKIFDSRAEAEERFAKGECAMLIGPSDSWADFRNIGDLDVAVTYIPYVDEVPGAPQNTLADGASLWVAAGKKAAENKAVASFISFWLNPDNQIIWQRDAGYLPLSKAGIFASESTLLSNELGGNKVAIKQLTNRPVSANSAFQPAIGREAARRILDEELASIWAGSKSAKAALDSAVARLSALK